MGSRRIERALRVQGTQTTVADVAVACEHVKTPAVLFCFWRVGGQVALGMVGEAAVRFSMQKQRDACVCLLHACLC